ncbi:MAG: adenylyltransferase/cytidyltransferase family protein [Campylobacterales bacterium]
MNTVALAVMRLQPLHRGHQLIIDTMLREAQTAIVVIGSLGAADERNPFSYEQRMRMIEALYPNELRLRVLGVRDIGAPDKAAWAAYVLEQIELAGLPAPTCYYAGNEEDASWLQSALPVRIVDRASLGRGISATAVRSALAAGLDTQGQVPPEVLAVIKDEKNGH